MGRKRDVKGKTKGRSGEVSDNSSDSSEEESLPLPFIKGMKTANMLFVYAEAELVRDIILTEV